MPQTRIRSRRLSFLLLSAPLFVAACGSNDTAIVSSTAAPTSDSPAPTGPQAATPCSGATGTITVYSGRSEALVAQLLADFTTATGVRVQVRYGDSGELAGQIITEGKASPTDVFFSQDAGALGAVESAGLLAALETSTLDRVPRAFRSATGSWVGASGRVRVIVYNPTLVATPPTTIDELLAPQWSGKIGFAPTNASWQSFVTALRVLRGEDGARAWLTTFAANKPVALEKNSAVRDAVNRGEVALGLINHYYLYELIAAEGAAAVVARNQFLAAGDPGGLVNVAGAGVLATSDNAQGAQCFASYLVSDPAQQYFVTKTYEYSLVAGIPAAEGLPELAGLNPPAVDLSDLRSIADTQELLSDVGLLNK